MLGRTCWVLLLITPCLMACQSQKQPRPAQLVPFEKDGRWGYRDAGGKPVIEARFAVAQEFSPEGIAAVVDEAGWAYIDPKGSVVIRPFVVDNGPDYFREGVARFTRAGKFGFFDQAGKIVIEPRFDFAMSFSEGLAAICEGCKEVAEGEHRAMRGGRWGFTNRRGEVVIPPTFEEVQSFQEGKARAKAVGKWKWINPKGERMPEGSIGSATMEADGTIVLQLRAEGQGGSRGDALLRYPPGHAQYEEVLRHLGGLTKGESKPVPPWPEKN